MTLTDQLSFSFNINYTNDSDASLPVKGRHHSQLSSFNPARTASTEVPIHLNEKNF